MGSRLTSQIHQRLLLYVGMSGRYSRWQIFHSPSGYATTNNPCEVFNASIKRYTLRKAFDIERLLKKLLIIAEDSSLCAPPVLSPGPVPAPQEAQRLAKVLVSTSRVTFYRTDDASTLRVQYLGDQADDDATEPLPAEMRRLGSQRRPDNEPESDVLEDSEKKSAAAFYRASIKW